MWDIIRAVGGLLFYPSIATWRERLWGVNVVVRIDGAAAVSGEPITASFSGRDVWGMGNKWGETIITEYQTPKGTVSTTHRWTRDMALAGVQQPQLQEHMIKCVDDYPIVEYILEHTEYIPNFEVIEELIEEFGDDGLLIGSAGFTPIHMLMLDYIGYGQCFYHMHDHPREFDRLLQVVRECTWEAKRIAAASPAEALMIGCNWSEMITSPPIFKKHFVPVLEELVDLMHSHGKLTTCHVDGDMKRLFKPFVETGVDIAEAISPAPLCNYTLGEAREILGSRMTIWGGIPTPLFTEVYSDREFDLYVRDIFRTVAPGDHFILAMGDNVPPDGVFERVYRVSQLVEELGNLPIDVDQLDALGAAPSS